MLARGKCITPSLGSISLIIIVYIRDKIKSQYFSVPITNGDLPRNTYNNILLRIVCIATYYSHIFIRHAQVVYNIIVFVCARALIFFFYRIPLFHYGLTAFTYRLRPTKV